MAVTSGIRAGRTMSAFATKTGKNAPPVSENQAKEIRDRLFAPLQESRAVSWHEFEEVLQRTLAEGMGPARSEWGMKRAQANFDLLDQWSGRVKAETFHDLCRTQEVYNMLTVARCMVAAARFRQESRFGQCHHRLDFPQTDDSRWLGQVTIEANEEGEAQAAFFPLMYR